MASQLQFPVRSSLGAAAGGATGVLSGSTYLASEMAKLGRFVAGWPGEVSGAVFGASTGAFAGFWVGSAIGALSGTNMIDYLLGEGLPGNAPTVPGPVQLVENLSDDTTDPSPPERVRAIQPPLGPRPIAVDDSPRDVGTSGGRPLPIPRQPAALTEVHPAPLVTFAGGKPIVAEGATIAAPRGSDGEDHGGGHGCSGGDCGCASCRG